MLFLEQVELQAQHTIEGDSHLCVLTHLEVVDNHAGQGGVGQKMLHVVTMMSMSLATTPVCMYRKGKKRRKIRHCSKRISHCSKLNNQNSTSGSAMSRKKLCGQPCNIRQCCIYLSCVTVQLCYDASLSTPHSIGKDLLTRALYK